MHLTHAQAIAHIRAVMERRKLSRAELAGALGVSRPYISNVLAGKTKPGAGLLAYFGITRFDCYALKAARRGR